MNLLNSFRSELSRIPYLNDALDGIMARIMAIWSVQHKGDGTHGNITADSLTLAADTSTGATGDLSIDGDVSADGGGVFGEDVIARYGSGSESGMGVLSSVNGSSLLSGVPTRHGILIGGVGTGYFLTKQAKSGAFSGVGDYQFTLWDLQAGTTAPVFQLALDTGEYSFIDGGSGSATMRFGNANRPMLEFHSTNGYYERGRSALIGEWTAVAFAAGNFTAQSGNWTLASGDQITLAYQMVGKTMTLAWYLVATTVSATPQYLKIAIPGGFTAARRITNVHSYQDNGGTFTNGPCFVDATEAFVRLYLADFGVSNWATATDATASVGQITFEVS